jgi:hypothetical protein
MDEDLSKLFELDLEINSGKTFQFPEDKLKELLSRGYRNIKVVVYGDSDSIIKESLIDANLYEEIKITQGLPGSVVLNFLHAKGSITSDKFKSRVNY